MRSLRLVLVALCMTVVVYAQDVKKTEVPSTFTEGLLETYPKATDIKWERSNDDYKVEFKNGDLEHKIYFNKQGDRVKIEAEMVKTTLPIKLAEAIKNDYSNYKIDSVRSVNKNGIITYEVIVVKDGWVEEISLVYSIAGEVLDAKKK